MWQKAQEERDMIYQVSFGGGKGPGQHPPSRLERFRLILAALFALAIFAAILFAAFFIGLILAIPLTILWIIWLARIGWRLKRQQPFNRF
ncbi:MAG: hypothetical protein WAO55_07685 [Candidatus Manganitrophaceae bacterium]